MKYIFGVLILIYALFGSAQQSHDIVGNDFSFDPDTAFVNVGDTVRLTSQGYHSITELDSTDWANNIATDNGGFWIGFGAITFDDWFIVNQAGKYYFNCNPHATMGMKGVLYVGASAGTDETGSTDLYEVYLDGANRLHLNYSKADQINIYSITGKQVYTKQLQLNSKSKIIDLNFKNGIYLVSYLNKTGILTTKKIIIK